MVTKAQIDKLHARIDEIAVRIDQHPPAAMCVIEYPDGWDTDLIFARHCETRPEDVRSPLKVFIRLFSIGDDLEELIAEQHPASRDNCDYESWRALARRELPAGRDPRVSLREPAAGARA